MTTEKSLVEKSKRLAALELRRGAAMNEFVASAMTGDSKDMERVRDNLHTLLDATLDQIAELMRTAQ